MSRSILETKFNLVTKLENLPIKVVFMVIYSESNIFIAYERVGVLIFVMLFLFYIYFYFLWPNYIWMYSIFFLIVLYICIYVYTLLV